MPLKSGDDPEIISQNIRELIASGRPKKQAVAITLDKSREGRDHGNGTTTERSHTQRRTR